MHHTYSTYDRGVEQLGTYRMLDLAPLGRNEGRRGGAWWRQHDEYESD